MTDYRWLFLLTIVPEEMSGGRRWMQKVSLREHTYWCRCRPNGARVDLPILPSPFPLCCRICYWYVVVIWLSRLFGAGYTRIWVGGSPCYHSSTRRKDKAGATLRCIESTCGSWWEVAKKPMRRESARLRSLPLKHHNSLNQMPPGSHNWRQTARHQFMIDSTEDLFVLRLHLSYNLIQAGCLRSYGRETSSINLLYKSKTSLIDWFRHVGSVDLHTCTIGWLLRF